MLKIVDMSVNYGQFEALSAINLIVEQGELVVLLGANGAGKSSIFKTISGLNKPKKGEIYLNDQIISGVAPDKIVTSGIVQCPEGRKLFPQMSVNENLLLGGYVHRRKKEQIKRSLEEVYELFPILKEKGGDEAGSLSGGQQQMLAIGRALMANPKLIMLDEPSIGLAPLVVEQVFNVITKINKKGTTVLLAEQNANLALKIANRGYVLETGKIVLKGTSEELLGNEEIRKAYIGA